MPEMDNKAATEYAIGLASTYTSLSVNNILGIYKGTMPASVDNFDPTTRASDLLVEFNNFSLINSSTKVRFNSFPSPDIVVASATGTATWYVIYKSAATGDFMGDVTANGGTGTTIITNDNAGGVVIVSADNVQILDFGITVVLT